MEARGIYTKTRQAEKHNFNPKRAENQTKITKGSANRMAKYTVEITENGMVQTIEFMGKQFKNTWVSDDNGSHTLEQAFEAQAEKVLSPHDEILEKIEEISFSDDDEIQEIISELSEYERWEQK